MHAFLITGDNKQIIDEYTDKLLKYLKATPITFALQKIEDARDLKKITKFEFSKKTAIVMNQIDKATEEALNAFLKDLEEPNKNLFYILTAQNIANIIPTIISRCQIIKTKKQKPPIANEKSRKFLEQNKKKQFEMIAEIKERDVAIKFVEDLIFFDHQRDNFDNMENYLYTLKNLKLNGNVSLQLFNLIVRMGSR